MTSKFTRSGPVHFQSLETELTPVLRHFGKSVLNAGCGDRDLGPWLTANGVGELVNYDIASAIPGAVLGRLEAMPFEDARFDTVLCNAVLEHVQPVEAVAREIARVLAPGGRAILAVPFLQPYHECPTDFRRFSAEGLADLGAAAGLTVLETRPVHSAAQTLGWIWWEIAKEKGRLWRAIAWPAIFLWTRLSMRTDPGIVRNANTFQIVFAKP